MEKLIILGVFVCTSLCASAQDVIVKKDGSTILSKVLEVNETNIKYKKFSNKTGPTYTISVENVLSVNYENGEKDTFSETTPSSPTSDKAEHTSEIHIVEPDSYNAELIARYNKPVRPNNKQGGRLAKRGFLFLGVDEQSVLSSEDIEINFVQEPFLRHGQGYWYGDFYIVQIHNKSDFPLYIDKGNSFRMPSNGQAYAYYDASETITIAHGSKSGGGVNLGAITGALGIGGSIGTLASGVNVGRGISSSSSTTYNPQRVIAIPPQGKVALEEYKSVEVDGEYINLSYSESIWHGFPKKNRPLVHIGGTLQYDMASSPFIYQYTITYSHHENFSDINVMKANIYIKELWGIDEHLPRYKTTEQKAREEMIELIPEKDDYTIVADWIITK